MLRKVYVASSWRNPIQPFVVNLLRDLGLDVYDFRHPTGPESGGFSWREIGEGWKNWTPEQFREALKHPLSEEGFGLDKRACEGADATICVLPCGKSAHMELGVAVGRGQRTAILSLPWEEFRDLQREAPFTYYDEENYKARNEPELMYKWSDLLVSMAELRAWATS